MNTRELKGSEWFAGIGPYVWRKMNILRMAHDVAGVVPLSHVVTWVKATPVLNISETIFLSFLQKTRFFWQHIPQILIYYILLIWAFRPLGQVVVCSHGSCLMGK